MPERTLTVKIIGDSSSLRREFNRSSKSAQGFQAQVTGIGGSLKTLGAATGATIGLRSLFQELNKDTQAASDLNEQVNKSKVIFGGSAKSILDWSRTTSSAFGISQRAALDAAGAFGQVLETSGLNEERAATMSRSLVELAADLASFNNIDPTDALDKLRSGLAGEAEPLRRVGVLLSESRVKQEAYRSGIAAVGSTLTEGQKVQARYNLILKDTARAQGDFSRTADGMANKERILAAKTEELRARLGKRLAPALDGLIDKMIQAENTAVGLGEALDKIGGKRIEIPGTDKGASAFGVLKKVVELNFKYANPVGQAFTIGNFLFGGKDVKRTARIDVEFDTTKLLAPKGAGGVPGIFEPGFKPGDAPPVPPGPTADQRNNWFDRMIGRREDRVQDITSLQGQLKQLDKIAALIRERLAKTKDITRQQTLGDELLGISRQQKAIRAQIEANAAAAKQLALDRERERIERERERAAARLAAVKAKQFRALGLAADGSEVVPGVKGLRRQLGNLSDAVEGTFLDTKKTSSLLARIRKVLSGGLGALSRDVRAKIAEMLADLDRQLKDHQSSSTKFRKADTDALLAGLGLSPDQIRSLRSRLSQVGPGGTVPGKGIGAFGLAIPAAGGTVVVENHVILDGREIASSTTKHQQKKTQRVASSRRGVRPGVQGG